MKPSQLVTVYIVILEVKAKDGLIGQLALTFLVSFVRLLPLAMTSPFLVMTHLACCARH